MVQLETRFCLVCGPEAGKKLKYPPKFTDADFNHQVFAARRAPDRRHFRMVECEGCGIVFSDPACDPSQLTALYETAQVNYKDLQEQIYQSYVPVLDRGLAATPGRKAFVEIGGGPGFMLKYGAQNGFAEQIEIEPGADAERKFVPASPRARFIRGIFAPGVLPPGSVSMACSFQVLDHIPNPVAFLREIFTALEPGGVIVCVNHNTRGFSVKVLGERSPIYDIQHTYLFHPENMRKLFKVAGFEPLQTFRVANSYPLSYWVAMAPLPAWTKRLARVVLGPLLRVRVKLYAGNFGIVAKKPL